MAEKNEVGSIIKPMSRAGIILLLTILFSCATAENRENQGNRHSFSEKEKFDFIAAIKSGNENRVVEYIGKGMPVGIKTKSGKKPITMALENGQTSIALRLIEGGADVTDWYKKKGISNSRLYSAIRKNDIEQLKILLKKGADPNAWDVHDGYPIHLAYDRGQRLLTTLLIEHKADISKPDDSGNSLLHKAIRSGDSEMVRDLLEVDALLFKGININSPNPNGEVPLMTALNLASKKNKVSQDLKTRQYAIIKILLSKNAVLAERLRQEDRYNRDFHPKKINPVRYALTELKDDSLAQFAAQHIKTPNKDIQLNQQSIISFGHCSREGINYSGYPINYAASGNKKKLVKILVKKGALKKSSAVTDNLGRHPLHNAAARGYTDLVRFFINHTVAINIPDLIHQTPLHLAAYGGHYETVKLLLKSGAAVNRKTMYRGEDFKKEELERFLGVTPLYFACMKGHANVAKLLIKNGASRKSISASGDSIFHAACQGGSEQIVRLLLAKKTNINKKNKLGQTPLTLALLYGHDNIAELLVRQGARKQPLQVLFNAACIGGAEHFIWKTLAKKNLAVEKDKYGWTPLHYAAMGKNMSIVPLLLTSGTSTSNTITLSPIPPLGKKLGWNSITEKKLTPLHLAILDGNIEFVKAFLSAESGKSAFVDKQSNLLHFAAQYGSARAIPLLVNNGFPVNQKNREGKIPLQVTIEDYRKKSRFEAATELVKLGADLTITFRYERRYREEAGNETILEIAVENNRVHLVKALLEKGALVNPPGKTGTELMAQAVITRNYDLIKLLLEAGVKTSGRNKLGNTALFQAIKMREHKITALLLKHGADINGQSSPRNHPPTIKPYYPDTTSHPATPLQLAMGNKDWALCKILLKKGANTAIPIAKRNDLWVPMSSSLYEKAELDHYSRYRETAEDLPLLQYAVLLESVPLVTLLLHHGAAINETNSYNRTALHHAAATGSQQIVSILLAAGAQVNVTDNNGVSPLFYAVRNGNKHITELLLSRGASLQVENTMGTTLLHAAAYSAMPSLVQKILNFGISVNATNENNETPLHFAMKKGDPETVKLLLKNGAKTEIKSKISYDERFSPLHIGVINNAIPAVPLLVKHGAQVDNTLSDNKTPLYFAAKFNNKKMVEILIQLGANINAKFNYGSTPLSIASDKGHCNMVQFLLKKGAHVNVQGKPYSSALHRAVESKGENYYSIMAALVQAGADINARNRQNATPLDAALQENNTDAIIFLINNGADLNKREANFLNYAAKKGRIDLINLLLKKKVRINAVESEDESPLCHAIDNNHDRAARLLIAKKANVNKGDPLLAAVRANDIEMIQLLLKKGARINKSQALFAATESFRFHIMKFLIKKGSPVNMKDDTGETPLFSAIQNYGYDENMRTIRFLLRKGARATVRSKSGNTVLHKAVEKEHPKLVKFFLKRGAPATAVNKEGITPLHYAAKRKNSEFAKLLLKHGARVNAETSEGETPLDMAYRYADDDENETIKLLKKAGARRGGIREE
ncbi:MAG: hypothetical protein GY754_07435 [bacterium]|nr:hypothetical protein [bacterium]